MGRPVRCQDFEFAPVGQGMSLGICGPQKLDEAVRAQANMLSIPR
jgi:hypothetical protein